jgi:subtilisin family serine protease
LGTYDFVLTVSAVDKADRRASFSNFGPEVDLAAPGAEIPVLLPKGAVGSLSGTSFAAPHVSGTLALILSANPRLSAKEAVEVLLRTCEGLNTTGIGRGLVDAHEAVSEARRP